MEFLCTSTEPIVQTKAGKIRGYRLNGTYTFHGIRYATARRFHLPEPEAPFEGVKDATAYGYIAPLMGKENPFGNIRVPHRYWPQDEDCLYLNVWSRDLTAKKPVMVWIHGGGFATGSSIEMEAYDGDALATYGDVVMVSVNHRLNILGYLDLSAYGEQYRDSGCAGIADLVEALRWVKENIAQFGGDPDNVTVFGQSGGGGKIQVLMQTPAAFGLFHKAILQSGVIDFGPKPTPEGHKKLVGAILDQLGITPAEVSKLEEVPFPELVAAYNAVAPGLRAEGIDVGWAPMPGGYYLGDGRDIGFCDFAKSIPVLVGSCIGEFGFMPLPPKKAELSEAAQREAIAGKFGDHTDEVIALYKAAYPGRNLVDLLVFDTNFRVPNLDFMDKRKAQSDAPIYSYLFALDFPINDGSPAWHCSEIPFAFHNAQKIAVCGIPGATERLEAQLSGAWTAFAHTGNPNNPALPAWNTYNADETTMVLDLTCEARQGYDRKLVELVAAVTPAFRH